MIRSFRHKGQAFVRQEFDDYLKCGLLEHGFLRVKCDGCRHEHLVAFSCKRRGFRFGSALNLTPHLHMLYLDGAYGFSGSKITFHRARRLQRDELVRLLHRLSGRIVRLLERRGLLIADAEHPSLDIEMGSGLEQVQAASINYRIAIGPQAGRKALTLYSVPPIEVESTPGLVARIAGFSLHAGTVCEAWQRSRLERLCRYITRPPTR